MKMLKKGLEFENLGHRTPDETPVVSGFESDVESDATLSCDKHDHLPFSAIFGAPGVFSAPQLMFYLLPLALRILKSGETYL